MKTAQIIIAIPVNNRRHTIDTMCRCVHTLSDNVSPWTADILMLFCSMTAAAVTSNTYDNACIINHHWKKTKTKKQNSMKHTISLHKQLKPIMVQIVSGIKPKQTDFLQNVSLWGTIMVHYNVTQSKQHIIKLCSVRNMISLNYPQGKSVTKAKQHLAWLCALIQKHCPLYANTAQRTVSV